MLPPAMAWTRKRLLANLHVEKCGLFVSLEIPWLAASPNGLVHDPAVSHPLGLVEIKIHTQFANFL